MKISKMDRKKNPLPCIIISNISAVVKPRTENFHTSKPSKKVIKYTAVIPWNRRDVSLSKTDCKHPRYRDRSVWDSSIAERAVWNFHCAVLYRRQNFWHSLPFPIVLQDFKWTVNMKWETVQFLGLPWAHNLTLEGQPQFEGRQMVPWPHLETILMVCVDSEGSNESVQMCRLPCAFSVCAK